MNKKKVLDQARLYVIVDADLLEHENLLKVTCEVMEGGADIIQFRDKSSKDREFLEVALGLKKIADGKGTPLIINDRVDIALYLDAAGVHLGEEDVPIAVARKILGKEKIIGMSASGLSRARVAQEEGADYVGVGPIFDTSTKKIEKPTGVELIRSCRKEIRIPFFAVGGISFENLSQIKEIGANRIAVASAVIRAEDVKAAARRLKGELVE